MFENKPFESISNYDYIDEPCRIYRERGVIVVMPEALASKLEMTRTKSESDAVAARRDNSVENTIFGVLNLLPNPGLVKEIIVASRTDGLEEQEAILFDKPTAKVVEPGRLILPEVLQRSEIAKAVVDGWSRLLWLRYEVETHFFRYAVHLEENSLNPADCTLSDFEKFALHLVRDFFLSSENEFASFIDAMPLRAVTLANAVARVCAEDPARCATHIYQRQESVRSSALPTAQEKLLTMLTNSPHNSDRMAIAIKLLLDVATAEQIATLKLSDIDLSNEPHNGRHFAKLGQISSLERLNLSQTLVTREGTGFLKDLSNLRHLNLSNTRIMSSSLNPLRGAAHLEELDISGTRVNESILAILPKIPNLKRVDVTGTDLPNVEDLRTALPGCLVIG